jgi:hypothetical protein
LRDVCPPRRGFGPRLLQLRAGLSAGLFIEIRNYYFRARLREPEGDRPGRCPIPRRSPKPPLPVRFMTPF